jgi:NAD(P)H-nitrite reductase large subunit
MVSDTDTPAFNPMLSPYYLKGVIPWENCFPFGRSFYTEYDITCHFHASVELLDHVNHQVALANGERLSYDRCLVATGASPVIPPYPDE